MCTGELIYKQIPSVSTSGPQHSRTPTCAPLLTTKATPPGRINKSTPSVAAGSHETHGFPVGERRPFLSFSFSKGSLCCAPGGDGGGAGAPAGGRRGLVGARERLAGVAGRDLLRPRRPLRRHRRRLIRKRLRLVAFC